MNTASPDMNEKSDARTKGRRTAVRLAHVISSDLGIPGLLPFCTPLLEEGWEVTILSPPGPNVHAADAAGVRWRPHRLTRRIDLRSDVTGTVDLARSLRAGHYDIVHTHTVKPGYLGRVVAGALRVPIVVHTLHGVIFSPESPAHVRLLHVTLEKLASLRCDMVLSQTEEDRSAFVRQGIIAPERITVIGNGIDLARFDPSKGTEERRRALREGLGVRPSDVLFVSASRLVRSKGLETAFAAAAIAARRNPQIRLAVAGIADPAREPIPDAVLEEARRRGVLLLGHRIDMPDVYTACDVALLPSEREGIPRTLMEAAAMGKPLIGTDVRGVREVIRPPSNGLRVPFGDAEALASAMGTLAGDEALRARLGRANTIEARARYDIRKPIELVRATYARLLERRAATEGGMR